MKLRKEIAGIPLAAILMIVLVIPLGIGIWWVQRSVHWKLSYGPKVEAQIESLSEEIQTLTRRVEVLEDAQKVDRAGIQNR